MNNKKKNTKKNIENKDGCLKLTPFANWGEFELIKK